MLWRSPGFRSNLSRLIAREARDEPLRRSTEAQYLFEVDAMYVEQRIHVLMAGVDKLVDVLIGKGRRWPLVIMSWRSDQCACT